MMYFVMIDYEQQLTSCFTRYEHYPAVMHINGVVISGVMKTLLCL